MRHAEIDLTPRDRPRRGLRRHLDIADLSKTLGAQQMFGNMLGGVAEGVAIGNAHSCYFERSLRGPCPRHIEDPSGTRERQRGQKTASGLHHRSQEPPVPFTLTPSARV